ncbi:MAG TPA: hypothetical protein VM122_10765, partial [Usitatibacter sp.]|nr:hypothetical protein [Usitatibacter sp.]
MMRRAFIALFILVLASGTAAQRPPGPTRVLFVGNSLTASTDVPARLAKLARAMGRDVVVDAVTANDYSLEDHWKDGRAQKRLAERWDFVVLQQG